MNGYNPMRWDCEKQGCFNKKQRPKIEVFADCFPGRINFADVDAQVEINGQFLYLEWKSFIGDIPTGQRIAYERRTKDGMSTVVVVCGDAETMEVSAIQVFRGGVAGKWQNCNLDELKAKIKLWSTRVKKKATA